MTNQEWMCSLTAKEFLDQMLWLLEDYGKSWTDSEPAIIEWLEDKHIVQLKVGDEHFRIRRETMENKYKCSWCPNHIAVHALNVLEQEALDYVDFAIDECRKKRPKRDNYLIDRLLDLNDIHVLRRKLRDGDMLLDIYLAPKP